eukprot:c31161_g1_i1 orf=3-260(-)
MIWSFTYNKIRENHMFKLGPNLESVLLCCLLSFQKDDSLAALPHEENVCCCFGRQGGNTIALIPIPPLNKKGSANASCMLLIFNTN